VWKEILREFGLNLELCVDMLIYLLTVIGVTPGGSSTVHICTQTIHTTTIILGRVQAVPHLCDLYSGICLTSEKKHE
jgi:hypothetical protein